MEDSKWERWSALGGILFVILILVAAFIPGSPPKTSDSAAKIAKFVTDKNDELRWAAYIGGLAVVALGWWLGAVWRLLRRAESGVPRLTVVALAGAVIAAVMYTLAGIILGVVAIVGVPHVGTTGTKFFYIFSFNTGAAGNFGVALFVGAFSAVVIRSGVLPKVLGWVGALAALLLLVGAGAVASTRDAFFVIGFVAFILFALWILVISVMMLRGTGAERPAASAS